VCDTPVTLFDEGLGVEGFALARLSLDIQHVAPGGATTVHFWSAAVAVGDPAHPDAVDWGLGDDVCPYQINKGRTNLGYGWLGAGNDRVRVTAVQGSTGCTNGALMVLPGAELEVWIEDGRPECQKQRVAIGSWYREAGVSDLYEWTTSPTPIVSTELSLVEPSRLSIFSVVEGSPHDNPNDACGAEASTLTMGTKLDGAWVGFSRDTVPASGGMGHVVLSTSTERDVAPGLHTATLLVASDFVPPPGFPVTTGGCCGDATIAIVAEPH
jgi:hypothetical protein